MTPIAQFDFGGPGFSLSITSALVVIAVIYLRGWHRLRKSRLHKLAGWRLGAFMVGVLTVWAAVASPLAMLDHALLTMHMVKHLLLMTVAAPLLLLGEPIFCFEHGLPQFLGRRLTLLLHRTPLQRAGRVLRNPAFCFLAATAVLMVWHLPAIFDLAMRSPLWHAIEVCSFLVGGILFWLPLIPAWSTSAGSLQWWIPLYLFLATLPCDALSAFLAFCDRVIYPCYTHRQLPIHLSAFQISALQDQQCAGALMWVCVTMIYLIPAVVVTVMLLSPAACYQHNVASADFAGTRLQAFQSSPRESA